MEIVKRIPHTPIHSRSRFGMFRGNYPSRIDQKGRLKLPADFKHEIDLNHNPYFYVTYLYGNGIEIYPMKAWEEIEGRILALQDSELALAKTFLDRAYYYGTSTSMDTQGRIPLPERLCKEAGITNKVVVIGKLTMFEVHGSVYEDHLRV
jgi:MraZ protein